MPKAFTPRPTFKPIITLHTTESITITCKAEDHFLSVVKYFRSLIESGKGIHDEDWNNTYHTIRIQETMRKQLVSHSIYNEIHNPKTS